MIDYELIGSRLKAARLKADKTQEELANSIDVTVQYISRIETGKAKPTLETLDKICQYLEADLGKILGGTSVKRKVYENDKLIKEYDECSPQMKEAVIRIIKDLKSIK